MEINTLEEAKQVGPAMLVTGALNPYTRAHEEMAGMAMQHAHKTGHTHFYHGIGSSELKPDAPLTHAQKTKLVTGSHRYLRKKHKLPLETGVIPKESSVSPFHQVAHLIQRGHRDITIALGSDQLIQGGLKSQIESHMKKHGGFLGLDKKPHQVNIKFHQLGGTRHEGDMDRAQIMREVAAGNLRTVKAGRLRGAVQSGDFELASAMMPESIKNKQGYFALIGKQQKLVADSMAKKKVRKKKLKESFSVEKIEEFAKLLNEAQIVRNAIEQRKNKRLDVMNKMKQQFAKMTAVLVQQQRTQKQTVGTSPELRQQHKTIRLQNRGNFLNNMRSALQNVKINFAGKILKAKKKEIDLGLDLPPRRIGAPQKPRRHTMNEEILNEARKRGVASPSKVMRKTRTDVRSAGNPKKKDTIRKQDERRDAKKSPKFAVVLGRDKKIKIVKKEDIGKSKIIVAPDKFDKAKAKRYLDDPTFEITDSSKKLFPEFKRKKAAKAPKGKKKEEKKKTNKKAKKPTVTKKDPRAILPPVPETPKGGKERTTQKSQYPDWNHNATDLEEAIPTVFNAIAKVKTGSEDAGATELLKVSKTLAPSTERAVRQIMGMVVPQIGECVAIHMGKQNDGKPTKEWLRSGGANATSKSDIVFVPKKLWQQAKGKNLSEKLKSIDASKCIRASMKCGASQIVNGEAGEAMATIDAANMIAGNIASKNRKVARLIKEAKNIISKFAKSAETGQYEVGEIRSYIESGKEPKDKAFAQAKRIVEEQDKVQKLASAKLVEIYNASPEFMEAFIYEGARGGVKHGDDSIRCATHMISMNKDGTDVKLQLIDMKLVRKLRPAIKFRCRFKPRSKMVKGVKIRTLSSAFNVDLRSIQEEVESEQQTQETPQIDFSGSAARVDEDLKMLGDDVTALTNYVELEPDLVATNEVDVGDFMEGSARDYNEIIIDGQTQIMIPVLDYQTFEDIKQNLSEGSYEFVNDFIVENIDDQDAFDLILTSGLISEQSIHKIVNESEQNYAEILNEMIETAILRPDLLDSFIEEARNYKKEYREYHSKPEQRSNRSKRVLARRKLMKQGRVRKGDGKDVHHEDGNPQNNGGSNLKVLSKSKNRAMHEEHGAGEVGTDELRKKYIQDTPFAVDPLKVLKGVVKNGVRRK